MPYLSRGREANFKSDVCAIFVFEERNLSNLKMFVFYLNLKREACQTDSLID